jgi:solute:Na+ symporter, SSS family
MLNISNTDLIIILIYVAGIIFYGIKSGKKSTSEEYFLGGKSMTWPVIGLSMFAANISSNSLVAITGGAYNGGISVFNYEWMASVVLVIFCIFILPFYIKTGIYTMPEYFEKRFDYRSRFYFSIITLIGNIFIDTAGTLYAGYKTISFFAGDLNPYLVVGSLAIFAASYTVLGGLSSVMKTEVVNTLILLFSACVLAVIVFNEAGSWEEVKAVANLKGDHMMHLVLPNSNKSMPWLGLVLGVPLLGFYFWCNNQFIVQRALSAKNIDEGRKGALFAGLLKIPVLFLLVFPGIIAISLLPNLKDSSEAYPTLLANYLPNGLIGLTIAGFLAAMASAVSATLNSASTLVSMDLIKKFNPQITSKKLVLSGQIATLVFMVIAVLWAPQISKSESFMDYMQGVLALISPPVVAVFLAGLFSKRTTSNGAFAGLITGLFIGVSFIILQIFGVSWASEIPFLIKAPILFATCLSITYLVSLMGKPKENFELENLVWSPILYREETIEMKGISWYNNYRILSAILLIITFTVVFIFR